MKTSGLASGFTLVELMFSLTVGAVILFAAVAMLGASADGYAQVGGQVSEEREYRMLMGGLASELASAVIHEDMRVERNDANWPAAQLGFLTLRPAAAQKAEQRIGDLCAVHYHVRDVTAAGRVERCLMRGFRDSGTTFDAARDNSVRKLFVPDARADEPIAQRVVSFDVVPQVMEAAGHWKDAPLPMSSAPEALRVRLVVASPGLAARLATSADWDAVDARDTGLEVFESVFPLSCHDDR